MAATERYGSELTYMDVCDRCGAVAMLRVLFSCGYELLFCWHHHVRYRPALMALDVVLELSPPVGLRV